MSARAHPPSAQGTGGGHAVVVGASMAGLCTARVLADAFDRVTVARPRSLPGRPLARRGVPQGRHVHVLLPTGALTLASLFPGLLEELLAAGAVSMPTERVRACLSGHRVAPAHTGFAELGYEPPPEERLDVDVHCATRHYHLGEALDGDRHVLVAPTHTGGVGGVLLAIGDGEPLRRRGCSRRGGPWMTLGGDAGTASLPAMFTLMIVRHRGRPTRAVHAGPQTP